MPSRGARCWSPKADGIRRRVLRADVTLLGNTVAALSPRATVRFHLGTTEVGARVVTPGGPLSAGETKPARLVLDAPIVARAGDRFVIRGGSPVGTLGGGVVVDPHPTHRRARPWTAQPRLVRCADFRWRCARRVGKGSMWSDLAVRLGASPSEVTACLERGWMAMLSGIGTRIFDARIATSSSRRSSQAVATTTTHGARWSPGAALQTIRGPARWPPRARGRCRATGSAATGQIETIEEGSFGESGWKPQLSNDQTDLKSTLRGTPRDRRAPSRPASASWLRRTGPRFVR